MHEPMLRHQFRLGAVLTTVDAVNSPSQQARQPEWHKQVAVADHLLLTKTDLIAAPAALSVERQLRALNPGADLHRSADLPSVDRLLSEGALDRSAKPERLRQWLADAAPAAADRHHDHDPNRHDGGIRAFALDLHRVDWTVFGVWLTLLLHARGQDVLRVKGILDVGAATPVVVHGVQHLIHPPVHLDRWPDGQRGSRLVFITRNIDKAVITSSLRAFQERLATVPA